MLSCWHFIYHYLILGMSLGEWLSTTLLPMWWQSYPLSWWVLFALLGVLLSPILWRLVVFLPLRLHGLWQESAQEELALTVTPCPSVWRLWAQAKNQAVLGSERRGRVLFCFLSGLVLGVVAWRFGMSWLTIWGGLLSLGLLVMAAIDARTHLLPDVLTLSCLWLGLLFHIAMGSTDALIAGVLGAVLGYGVLWLVAMVFKGFTGQDGMGYGDFKLFAALGAWLGWAALPWVLFFAAALGVLWALLGNQKRRSAIPFGPSLSLAGWLVWLWGPIF